MKFLSFPQVMEMMSKYCKGGRLIVCTIHQPRSQVGTDRRAFITQKRRHPHTPRGSHIHRPLLTQKRNMMTHQ